MAFNANENRALKFIEEFESGPKMSDLRLKSAARLSEVFPLHAELLSSNPLKGCYLNKRLFDDSTINRNDSLLKKRRTEIKPNDESDTSLNSSDLLSSPGELRRVKGDLISAKAEISALEANYNKVLNIRKEDLLQFEEKKNIFEQAIENNRQSMVKLEAKLRKMQRTEQQLKDELESVNDVKSKHVNTLEEKNNSLLQENMSLKSRISEMEIKGDEANREINTHKTELTVLKEELALNTEQITKLQAQMNELKLKARQHELDKASLIIAQRKISELESTAKNYSETAALLKDQESKLIRMSELEKHLTLLKSENINLREGQNKMLRMNEEVSDLNAKVKDMEYLEDLLKTIKVDLGLARNELTEFRNLAKGVVGEGMGHLELGAYVREMQQGRLVDHSDLASLRAKLKTLEDLYKGITTENANLKGEMSKLKAELELHDNTIKRLKKQYSYMTWERNDLRKMLDSIQKETTVVCVDSKVDALERLVDGYKRRVDDMEQEMAKSLPVLSPTRADSSTSLEQEKKKNSELKEKIEKLEYELEHRNLKGDFDTRNSKILHMKMNPTDEALNVREDDLKKAQTEVQVLREKIRILQDTQNTSQAINVTDIAFDKVHENQSIDELREKIKSQDIQRQRLIDTFKEKSSEIKEAIHSLLGYTISSVLNKKLYKLTSMYAPDLHLLFQMQPEGGMEMLETEMSKSLQDLIDIHLCQDNSIPMFLSALTMRLHHIHSTSQSTILE